MAVSSKRGLELVAEQGVETGETGVRVLITTT